MSFVVGLALEEGRLGSEAKLFACVLDVTEELAESSRDY
jgi:hypothetical protein